MGPVPSEQGLLLWRDSAWSNRGYGAARKAKPRRPAGRADGLPRGTEYS
jgi:hypothetical protein